MKATTAASALALAVMLSACGGAGSESASDSSAATPSTGAPILGEQLYDLLGCANCHSSDGTDRVTGPTHLGAFGTEVQLEDGSVVLRDRDYLRRSIVEPAAQIVPGYSAEMVDTFGETLTAEQVDSLVEYLVGLSG